MNKFDLTPDRRAEMLTAVMAHLESFYKDTKSLKISSVWNPTEVKAYAKEFKLEKENDPYEVLDHVIKGLSNFAVHTPHPNYYGLFNPRPNFVSILSDLITATFNPQLAAWSHSPFANEIENYVIQEFGKKFGYDDSSIDGTFCSGGAESNLTAVLTALNFHFPEVSEKGVFGLSKLPIIYCSSESHHSIAKAAKNVGLGMNAVRSIPVNKNLQIDIDLLKKQIKKDRTDGHHPFMMVGTAGTTGAGAIDDLNALGLICKKEKLWFHVDAAYGGAIIISNYYKKHLAGIEKSDSITLDIHKWLSVPMGASIFFTSNKEILHRTFGIKTKYMPKDGDRSVIIDPYVHSIQWSRRFIGLKAYLPIAIFGWEGYEASINHQFEMGNLFRSLLEKGGWEIKNNSSLPIICFTHPDFASANLSVIMDEIVENGKAWFSLYPIHGANTFRVCITNYATDVEEIHELYNLLDGVRNKVNS